MMWCGDGVEVHGGWDADSIRVCGYRKWSVLEQSVMGWGWCCGKGRWYCNTVGVSGDRLEH